MPWFEGTHTESRTVDAAPEAVRNHFANLDTIVAHTKDVESGNIDGRTVHFVLKEENHAGVLTFQANFKCTYVLDGDTLTWTSADGNMDQAGKATFTADGSGTKIDYTETVKVNLDVPAMMSPMLKPVFSAMASQEVAAFVKRMCASL